MIVHQGHMIIIILYLDQPTFFHKSGTAGLLCDPDEDRGEEVAQKYMELRLW